MKGVRGWLIAILLLWFAGALQQAVAFQVSVGGAGPDFLLTSLVTLSLFSLRRSGSVVGFIAGALQGAIAGGHMGFYVVSRTLVGFSVGWFTGFEFEGNPTVSAIVAAVSTLVVNLAYFLMNPHGAILSALLATIGSAVYNGVLAIPLYALLKKVLDSPRR